MAFADRMEVFRMDDPQPGIGIRVDLFAGAAPDLFIGWADVENFSAAQVADPENAVDVLRDLEEQFLAFREIIPPASFPSAPVRSRGISGHRHALPCRKDTF